MFPCPSGYLERPILVNLNPETFISLSACSQGTVELMPSTQAARKLAYPICRSDGRINYGATLLLTFNVGVV